MSKSYWHFGITCALFVWSLSAWSNPSRRYEYLNAVNKLGLSYLRDGSDSKTSAWVQSQNNRTLEYLTKENGAVNPLWSAITARSKEITATNTPMTFELKSGQYLYTKAGGLALRQGADGAEVMVAEKQIIPNNGGALVVADFKVSPNEQLVAVSYIRNGSDLNEWSVYDISSQKRLAGPFVVRMNEFNWALDSKGLYYTKWASVAEVNSGVFYARNSYYNLSTQKEEIAFVAPQKDTREYFGVEEGLDRNGDLFAVAYRNQGVAEIPLSMYIGRKNSKEQAEFKVGDFNWNTIFHSNRNRLGKFLGIRNGLIYFRVSDVGRDFGVQVLDPVAKKWAMVIPADPVRAQLAVQIIGSKIYVQYLNKKSSISEIGVFALNGSLVSKRLYKISELLPQANNWGTLSGFLGGPNSQWVYFTYGEAALPTVTFKINSESAQLVLVPNSEVNFDSKRVTTKVVNVSTTEGMTVPVRVIQRTDIKEPRFIYYYYYGYIGANTFTMWNRKFQAMLDLGGAVALVNARGGGEFGHQWQMLAKDRRQRTFEDIVSGAVYLRRTFPKAKIVASGRSFGGLTTYVLQTQYNRFFDAFSSVVPISSMHEFFNRGLFGFYALDDFGIQRDKNGQLIDDLKFRSKISEFSPLENIDKMKVLKPIITFTGEMDERVGPEQGRYMTQALMNKFPQQQDQIYYFEQPQNGHVGRAEYDQEAMFVAKLVGLKLEDYSPLRK